MQGIAHVRLQKGVRRSPDGGRQRADRGRVGDGQHQTDSEVGPLDTVLFRRGRGHVVAFVQQTGHDTTVDSSAVGGFHIQAFTNGGVFVLS